MEDNKRLVQDMSISLTVIANKNPEIKKSLSDLKKVFDELVDERYSKYFPENDLVHYKKIKKQVINKVLDELLYY